MEMQSKVWKKLQPKTSQMKKAMFTISAKYPQLLLYTSDYLLKLNF